MTFTFDPSLSNSTSLVRFHIGDTNAEGGHFLEDETIAYWVAQTDVPHAVIECIKYIITQLSTPDFTQYWLKVSNEKAREGFERLLANKQKEFGIADNGYRLRSIISHPYRPDSYMTDGEQDGRP